MTHQTAETDCRHLVKKYPDAHEAVCEMIADMISETMDGESEVSQDWVSDASDICNAHGVADEDQVDLIAEAFRTAQYNKIDQTIERFKFLVKGI